MLPARVARVTPAAAAATGPDDDKQTARVAGFDGVTLVTHPDPNGVSGLSPLVLRATLVAQVSEKPSQGAHWDSPPGPPVVAGLAVPSYDNRGEKTTKHY